MSLDSFITKLEKDGDIKKIVKPVSTKYEIAAIMKRLDGKALLFENVKGYDYKVVANVCSSRDLISKALGIEKEKMIEKLAKAIDNPKEPVVGNADYKEIDDLTKLPILLHYEKDGGPYISSAIVVANDSKYGINSSFHRMMVIGKDEVVIRIIPRHFDEYIKRGLKKFAICIGPDPQVLLASGISCEIGKSEIAIANALKETKTVELDGHVVPDSEIVMIAELTGKTSKEGPFMDLTETYDIVREQLTAKINKIFVKENPFYHALLPGGLEHKMLMGMPREPGIFREVSKVCECKNVYITPGGCSWLHGVVQIKKKAADDGKKAIEAAFKGHKSMKHVFVVDDDINIYNPDEIEWAIATRFQGDKDMVIKKDVGSSLDPSSNLETRETIKIGFDLTVPWDKDKEGFKKHKVPGEDDVDIDR